MNDKDGREQNLHLEPLSRVVGGAMRFLLEQGKSGVEWSTSEGRIQLEKRQLLKDRQAMWAKLGREVCALAEGGEIEHPGLLRGAQRILDIDARIEALGSQEPIGD